VVNLKIADPSAMSYSFFRWCTSNLNSPIKIPKKVPDLFFRLSFPFPARNETATYYSHNRLMSTDMALYDYDNEGQLASKQEGGTTNYTFDKAYRLTGIGADTFAYDGAGNRLRAVKGGVETRYIYDANGNLLAEANGFYYMRARYYDPVNGRFISEDPMGFDGGDVNLYVYGSNNPVLLVDPSGEFITILGGAVGGGLAGGITGGIVGFLSSLPTATSFRDVVIGTVTGAAVGTVVGAVAGAVIGAGQPELALSAGRLAGASLFRQGFMAATTAGEHAALTSNLGALAGGAASVATSPTPAYGNNSSSNIHSRSQVSSWK